ncbi:MAG: galactose oxidase [Candidatus Bipolaricaulota bacterium]|nr:galactose oxidase [Candidatus Bipolaricaulota bacterium]MCS7273990.1 galactose oxidase [Candidatus Bipolaricaulota bacterium]MDW8111343.1 kelch repeat-containing protein [Candidatus Bipolaricaulota bacterium]MDW8329237.1 kelch repeat-containing protein [Candidatus Bipolaricaulota bacterium]
MHLRLVVAICILGGLVGVASAQEMGRWLKGAPLPVPRSEVAVAEVSGKIYVIGGFDGDRRTSAVVEAYDPATDQWTPIAPLPRGLNHPMAAGANGKLYVIGGYLGPALNNATNALWEYDPATQRWIERAAMPTVRAAGAAVVVDGKIYVVGGARATGSVGDFAVYDPQTNRWTTLPAMPTPRDHIAAGAYGKKIYVAGGRPPFTGGLRTLEVFDLEAQRWAALAPMPTGRSGIAGAVVRGCFYVFGGEGNRQSATGVYEQNEVYDPKSNRWESQPPMPTPRHGIGAAVWENRIYIPGGAPLLGFSVSNAHEVYEPTKSCE